MCSSDLAADTAPMRVAPLAQQAPRTRVAPLATPGAWTWVAPLAQTTLTWVAPLAHGELTRVAPLALPSPTTTTATNNMYTTNTTTCWSYHVQPQPMRVAPLAASAMRVAPLAASADAGSSARAETQAAGTGHGPEGITKVPLPQNEVRGTKSGQPLELQKVMEGRQKELDSIHRFGVKRDITVQRAKEMGLKFVHAKWLDDKKPTPADPAAVRSRLVATEVATYAREDVSQSTPPLRGSRLIVSLAATKRNQAGEHTRLVARYDISVAFFHADSTGQIAVIPPKGLAHPGWCWHLEKAMYGTREASQQWGKKVTQVMVSGTVPGDGASAGSSASAGHEQRHSFKEVLVVPMTFYCKELDVTVNCHGDDFLAEGEAASLDRLDDLLSRNFQCKILPRIGPPAYGGQTTSGKHLGRTISWTSEGFTWDGAETHCNDLLQMLGLKSSSNGVSTPASKDTGKNARDAADELDDSKAALFRRAAGTALHISLDRPSIMFAMVDIMAGMAKPTELHYARLLRLARYLLRHPTETWVYRYQSSPKELLVYTDSDWAADKETRRSVSCLAERYGDHLLEVSVAKQTVVALSSGEAEFYGIVRATAHGIQTKQLLEACNQKLQLTVLSDSSAARGMCTRTGSGKVRHLDIKELWVQQKYRDRVFDLRPVDTLLNWADLGTKAHEQTRLDSLCRQMQLRREGRNAAAGAAAGSSARAAGTPDAQASSR